MSQQINPLHDTLHFNLDLIAKARAGGRHLFGHAAHVLCTEIAKAGAGQAKQKTGLLGRLFGTSDTGLPGQAEIVRWIEGGAGLPPNIAAPVRRDFAVALRQDSVRRTINSALHPDALWSAEAARRFAQLHVFLESGGNHPGIVNVPPQLAMRYFYHRCQEMARIVPARHRMEDPCAAFMGMTLQRLADVGDVTPRDVLMFLLDRHQSNQVFIPHTLPGVRETVAANVGPLIEFSRQGGEKLARLLNLVKDLEMLDVFPDAIFHLATSTKVKDRKAAEPFVELFPTETLGAAVARVAADASPVGRAALYETLATLRGDEMRPHFEDWLATEQAARPKAVMESALSRLALAESPEVPDDTEGYAAADGTRVSLAPLPPEGDVPNPDPAVLDLLRHAAKSYNAGIETFNAEKIRLAKDFAARTGRPLKPSVLDPITEAQIDDAMRMMCGHDREREPKPNQYGVRPLRHRPAHSVIADALRRSYDRVVFDGSLLTRFFDQSDLHWQHLVRLNERVIGALLNDATADDKHSLAGAIWRRIQGGVHLREVLRLKPDAIQRDRMYRLDFADYGYDDFWMAFLPELDAIIGELSSAGRAPGNRYQSDPVRNAMRLLAEFPKIPMRAVPDLLRIAMGPERKWRTVAQHLLAGVEQVTPMIVDALGDGKVDIRSEAALWLGRRGDAAVIPAIEARLKKERTEAGRAALMTGLRALGGDLKPWLDEKALQTEASKALAKMKLDTVEWLLPGLPTDLTWADGRTLSPDILRYWVGLAVKLKQPGGNGLFALWLDELDPGSAGRLGQAVVTAWLNRDVLPMPEADAQAKALADLPAWRGTWRLPRHLQNAPDGDVVAWLADRNRQEMTGASDTKGVLALGMRAHGADTATAARAYLKKHGERVSQAKAVVEAMAANPHPAAIQVVIGVAERFRQKSVQKLAQELVEQIADDRGWTADELADRTIPTGGFDARGQMDLDVGKGRIFTAQLASDGAITLTNADGKSVKALPAPSGDEDDIARAKDAKKALSAAKKEIKQVTEQLTTRLFEAMCLERTWPLDDWRDHLQTHPLAGRLCQRLVWIGLDDAGTEVAIFRPMDDGSLTDREDDEVASDFAAVRLVHGGLMQPEDRAAWKVHLADYEVRPLFDQFADPAPLDGKDKDATEITDRLGWIIETFTLRGQAKKHGYERGPILDGGGFDSYVRLFRNAGLVVELSFSGSMVPEENFEAALLEARVRRLRGDTYGPALVLGDIPPALLTAVRTDLAAIAAAGTGYAENYRSYGY